MATITLMDDDDLVNAGDEDDIIYAGGGNDTVNAGGGNDTLMGDTGDDLLAGGAGDDQLLGDAGSDRLYGGEGNDVLDGGTTFWTEDFLAGGPGDETYVIEWNRDAVVEAPSEGVDLIRAAAGNYFFGAYTLPDGVENLDAGQVSGTTVRGNALDNVITGSSGNDQLYGLSGSDHLIGGDGGDTLIGDGEGSDSGQVSLYDVGRGVGGVRINGEKANDYAGSSLTGLGDVNGDGHADIAVGASSAVYVLFGPFGNNWQINLNDAAAGIGGYKIVASGSEYIYGSITSAGDVNGDGLGDLLIANYNDPEGGGGYSGAAFVVFGKADGGQIDLAQVAAGNGGFKIVGEYGNQYGYYYGDWAGYSLSAAGDLNADGNDDVLIGARWNDEGGYQAGAAYVVWGKADGLKVNLDDVANGVGGYKIVGENGDRQRADGPGDAAGESVAGVGDVNGDAIPDLLIGAPGQAASYLVYGKADNGKINLDDVAQGIGGFKISGAGSSVASGGDVNGDGRTDYLIGGSGVSYVVFGSATPGNVLLTEVGAGNGGYALNFGGSPVNLGDINGDGRGDLLVTNFTSQQSSIYHSGVVFGRAGGTPVNAAEILAGIGGFAIGIEQYVSFSATAAPGDVTGDGVPDLLAGSTYNDNNRGYAYLIDGHAAAHVRGDDLIEGGAGDDWLVGGGGSDKLDGGIGTDTADYSGSAGAVMANLGVGMATQDGLGGTDTLVDMENLNGSAHADKLLGSALANALYGQNGDDELWAGAGADLLDGGAGNDVLGSDAGADTLTGGAGADCFVLLPGMEGETITDFVRGQDRIDVAGFGALVADWAALRARVSYVSGEARIDFGNGDLLTIKGMPVDGLTEADFVGLGALGERWVGSTGDDGYSGTPFDDVLDGLAGNDTVNAGGGDDVLTGDTGDDRLEGGAGDDRLEGNGGNDTLDGAAGIDTADYSRALGSVGVDLGAGLAADDGNLGSDTLIDIENVIGSPYADRLVGNDVSNGLLGSFGNDVLIGLGGNDVLDGASGNDTLYGGAGDDRLIGGAANEDDYLYGGEGNDTLEDFGTPWLRGNTLAGGPGDDTYIVGDATWGGIVELPNEGDDHIIADLASADYIAFSSVLQDNVERLSITKPGMARGNALDNVITGSTGNDRLIGLAGTDHLIGGAGNDTLLGDGEGADSGQVSLYDVGRGVGGVRINGEKANDYAGSSLAGLGDVNGDGHADIAVGASSAVYVLFGPFGNDWQVNLNDAAAGIGGYKIVASGSEYIYGSITSAGDVNGDGLGDLLIANYNDPEGGGGYSGSAFVVFGKADGGQIDLAQVAAGNGGFKIVGEYGNQYGYYYGDWAGYSLSAAGDLNADGNDDVLIGARWNDEGGYQAGAAYVVWGKADGLKVNLDDVANGVGGYKIVGENGDRQRADGPGDAAGESVAGVGDVNGDAIPDLLIGAPGHAASYLVYGKADNGKINLDDVAQGIGGFKISGAGSSVASGGDVNGDGHTDYLIGASGTSYVVFGSANPSHVSLTDVAAGNGGYRLDFGGAPIRAGDLNGDGRDDQLVLNFNYPRSVLSGVVYGKGSGVPVGVGDLTGGTGGFAVANEYSEWMRGMAAAGDVDADGVPDFLISTAGPSNVGVTYVVLGKDAVHVRGDDLIEGGAGDDALIGGGGNDTLIGGAGNDYLRGGDGDDALDPGIDGDVLDGGTGTDRLILDWSGVGVTGSGDGIAMEAYDASGAPTEDPTLAVEWSIQQGATTVNLVTARGMEVFDLAGTAADDVLRGTVLADTLKGGAGDDVLDGHAGADRLTGDEGADTFRGTLAELDGDTISDLCTLDAFLVTGDRLTANQVAFSNGTLRIDTNGDGLSEAEIGLEGSFYGRFEVTASDPADAAATTVRYVTEPPVISIKALDDEKAEGESGVTPFTFEVTRSGDLNGTSSVDYAVSGWGDNPSDWRDFNGSVIGTITFSAGESSRMLTVSVASDDAPGLRESFAVQLSNATNATFAIPSAMASVYEPPFLTKANLTATELTMVNGFIHSAYGQPIPGGYRLLGHTDLPTIPAGRFDAQGFFVGDPIPNTPLAQDPQRCLPVISNNGMEIILVHPGGKVASDAHTHGELYQGESLLISAIRTYVQLQYPTASPDLWIVGHSRGGSTVNEIFTQEKNRAGPTDIFDQARYIAFAPGNVQGNSVLLREIANIGFENDYVFKRLQGGINDESDPKRLPENTSTTDNLVFFWEDYTDSRSGWGRDANSMRAHALDASDLFVEVATDPLYTQYIFEDSAVLLNHDASKTYDFRHITSSHYGSSVTIFGRAAKDEIIGSAYGDNLFGRSGDDTIIGLGGIDNIFGGSGSDSLSGGPDQDRFIGTQSELNGDTIKDFWSEDVIRFDGARFSSRELNYQVGSLLIDSDTNGTFETTIKLGADLSPGKFVATQSSPGEPVHTLITYEASDALVWIVPPSVSYYEGDVGSVTEYVYTVIRSGDLEKPSIVHCTIAPDGADGADPDDFEGGVFPKSRELIFQRDETSKDLRIRVQGDDQKNENDEGFKITLSPITNATVVGDKKEAIGVIQDDDTYPRLTISDATAMEDDGKIVFSISRSGDLKYDSAVNWRVEFEAGQADGTDLGNVLHGTAFFKSGNASPEVPLEIDIVDDSLKEPNETFKVFLDKPLQLVVKDPEAQGTIKDDDSPKQVSIKAVDAEKAEGTDISAPPRATPFTFEVWRAGTSDEAFSVRYTVTGAGVSAADVTTDLMGLTTDTLDFAEKEPSKTITIEVVPDDRDEDDEGFVVTLSQATNGFEIDQETARGLIQNDDDLEFSIAPDGGSSQQEGNAGTTYFTFTVSRGGNAHAGDIECSVDYAVALGPKGGVWADSNDFDGKIIGTVTFAADGVLSKTISIPVKGDADPELDERFYVQLTNPGRKAAGAAATPVIGTDKALGTIGDDDSRKLSIVSEVSKSEGTDTTAPVQWTEMQFTVTRTNTQGPVEVSYGVTPGPTLPADDQDVQGLSYTDKLNFADGQGSAVITVKVNPDGNIEPNETFFVTLGDLAGWTFSNRQSVGTIEDDDAQKVSIVSSVSRAEGSNGGTTPFRFEVTRSNTHGVLELSYGVTGGPQSPADGSDIANMGIGKLKFEDGEGKQWIVVDINRDNDEERNETFFVTLGDPGTGLKFGNRQAVGTIGNDDISLPPWPRPVFRGDPHLTTLDGLAYDFQAVGEFVAMQSPNGHDVLVQVRTAPVGDLASNITAVAMLLDGHRVTLTAGEAATLRIDGVQTEIPLNQGFIAVGGGTVTFDGDAYTVIDPDGAGMHVQSFPDRLDLTLTVGAAFSGNLQGLLGNFNGAPADDLVLPDGSVLSQPVAFGDLYGRFADSWRVTMATSLFDYGPGESSATFTDHSFPRQAVTLDMLPPAIVARATALVDEAGIADPTARAAAILDLALTGDMSYLRSAAIPVPVTQVAQVVDVPAPLPSLSILGPEGVQWEGDTGGNHIRFDVFRSGDTTGALPVVYEVVPFGTHPADADDFGGTWPTGVLEFADGEGAKPIEIILSGDILAEYSEGFAVRLSVSSEDRGRVLLAASSARVTIENDDGDVPARFDIEPVVASAAEGDAGSVELTFSVIRSDNLATEALVSYAVLGYGRAASADDFAGGSYPAGTLAFLPNERHKVISITVAPDADVEFDESFVVWLANPINGVVGAAAAAGSILNDDVPPAPALAIVAIDAHRPEGNGDTTPFSFVVTRTGDLTGTSTVAYVVTGSGSNSASATDFGGALPSGTISFAANEASKTVTVDVSGDTTVEPDEGFTVTLSDPSNATISTATAEGTIVNDDAPPPPTLAIATCGCQQAGGGIAGRRFQLCRYPQRRHQRRHQR
jgi:Ca2+-binding RTX toxin-like protein